MLMRTDPFRDLDRLTGARPGPATIPLDAYRADGRFVIELDLPGIDPSTIELTLQRNVLTVTAERPWRHGEVDGDGEQILASERVHGRFTRQLFLGDGLDLDQVSARYDQGVLVITVPVADRAAPRRIEVAAGSGAAVDARSTAA